jgi:hypothetical protein
MEVAMAVVVIDVWGVQCRRAVVVIDVWGVQCRRALQLRRWIRRSSALSIIPTSARVVRIVCSIST